MCDLSKPTELTREDIVKALKELYDIEIEERYGNRFLESTATCLGDGIDPPKGEFPAYKSMEDI